MENLGSKPKGFTKQLLTQSTQVQPHRSQATLAQLGAREHGCHANHMRKEARLKSMPYRSLHNSASNASAVRHTLCGTVPPSRNLPLHIMRQIIAPALALSQWLLPSVCLALPRQTAAHGRACALRMKCSVSTGQMAHPGCPARHQASAAWRCRRRARSRCCVPSCPVSVASMVSSAPPLSAPRFCSRPARNTNQKPAHIKFSWLWAWSPRSH